MIVPWVSRVYSICTLRAVICIPEGAAYTGIHKYIQVCTSIYMGIHDVYTTIYENSQVCTCIQRYTWSINKYTQLYAYNERVIIVGIGWVLLASATSRFSGYIKLAYCFSAKGAPVAQLVRASD